MALSEVELQNIIMTSTFGKTNATDALLDLGRVIASYIKANAIVSPGGEIISLDFVLTPSMAAIQSSAYSHLISEFVAGLTAAMYTVLVQEGSNMVLETLPMSTSPSLSGLTFSVTGYDREAAFLSFSTSIVTWVKSQLPEKVASIS